MATPDMDVIKEIPGYKVILKAVLKSQIQQLVEQLASHTDEESVILTASVSDGTLSHLGSDSGKFFLDDHEDIKSQFLGFCLKRHHRKKQEKDREEAAMRNMQAGAYGIGPSSVVQRSPRMQSPRQQGVHPVSLTRASPGSGIRGSMRHEPYRVARPKRTSLTFDQQGSGNQTATVPSSTVGSSAVVKIEPADDNNTDLSNTTPSQNNLKTEFEQSNPSSDPQDVKFSDTQTASGLSLDSDLTNLISQETSQQLDGNEDNVIETNTATIKTEAISESDMELEITGVEPGRLESPQENWGANSTQTEYDQSGATGSSVEGQGYSLRTCRKPSAIMKGPYVVSDKADSTENTSKGRKPEKTRKGDCKSYHLKYKAILEVEKGQETRSKIAKEFGVPITTLSTWLKYKDLIKTRVLEGTIGLNRKNVYPRRFPQVESALVAWIENALSENIVVNEDLVIEKAKYIAANLGFMIDHSDFTTSWLARFKNRHGISFEKTDGAS